MSELTATNSRLGDQLHGLQTLLSTKAAQARRMDMEAKQLAKQLKQAEAAAAADQQELNVQLGQLSERAVELQGEVAAGQAREQALQHQLVMARDKVRLLEECVQGDAPPWSMQCMWHSGLCKPCRQALRVCLCVCAF